MGQYSLWPIFQLLDLESPISVESTPSHVCTVLEKTWLRRGSYGDFLLARPISDTMNLAMISLRLGGRRLPSDSAGAKITNIPEANRFLTCEYRPGWELQKF
jgi:hypothetical protein